MRVRLGSAVALRAVIASSVFVCGCAVSEIGQIPCADDSSCPKDYPVCKSGKCVPGTGGTSAEVSSTTAAPGGKWVVEVEKGMPAETTATIAAHSVGSPLTFLGNQSVMIGGSITMPPGGGPPPTSITFSLTLSENCPTGMHVVPVISTDFSVTPNARIPDKILPVPSLVDCVGNTSSPGEPRVISPGSSVLLLATPHKYGLPAGATLELTASDYTCPLEAASCATAFVDNHTCVADNQCFSNYCSPTLHVCTPLPCPSTEIRCSAGGSCTNVLTDPANCGACGSVCQGGAICSGGTCATCPSQDVVCNNTCVDTTTDATNCGICGKVCPAGTTCSSSSCVTSSSTCSAPSMFCRGVCVNPQEDNKNCGACGVACASGTSCNSGTCGITCLASETKCGSGLTATCTNLNSDNLNCGTCGTACPAGEACINGMCADTCLASQTLCGTGSNAVCATLSTDNKNCGACGTVCGAGRVCSSGACIASCGSSQTACSGTCTSTMIDPNNCGACGTTCPNPANGKDYCASGTCATACNAGYSLCGTACDNTATDPNNCGACGHACLAPVYGASSCTNGGCGFSCPAGDSPCTTPTSSLPICCATGSSCSLTCPH